MKIKRFRLSRFLFALNGFINRHLRLIISIILLLIVSTISFQLYKFLQHYNFGVKKIIQITKSPEEYLDHTNDRTNFLIMGVRGGEGDSPDLTDTLLIVSYSFSSHQVTMISVPRDLWVDSIKAKINTAYHYGGLPLIQASILETTGIPIHYSGIIDFSAFEQLIDYLGGIDIDINPGFTDHLYPIAGKENDYPESSRYETIVFATGSAHLDGSTALKFVRSRHADGEEGTDFARSKRQQQVILAIRQKIFSNNIIFNQDKIDDLLSIIQQNLVTNIGQDLYPTLIRVAIDSQNNSINHINLSIDPDDQGIKILENPKNTSLYQGQWVLIAKDENWEALKKYIYNKLNGVQ